MSQSVALMLAGCFKTSVTVESLDSTVQQLKEVLAEALGQFWHLPSADDCLRRNHTLCGPRCV